MKRNIITSIAILLLLCLPTQSTAQRLNGDLDHDGEITVADVIGMQNVILQKQVPEVIMTNTNEIISTAPPTVRLKPNEKLPVISFIFDDCNKYDNDISVANLFKENGLTCGFAFIATDKNINNCANYLNLHLQGFSILSHSTDANTVTDEDALEKVSTSIEKLTKAGFVVNGWVSPNSVFPLSSRDLLKRFYAYAFTNGSKCSRGDNPCAIIRSSMQAPTIESIKATIDQYIQEDKCLVFYGHTWDFGKTYNGELWDIDKVRTILNYCIEKRNEGLVYIGNPDEAMQYYFDIK